MLGDGRFKALLKWALARANRPVASHRLRGALDNPGPHRVIIGCGRVRPQGWLPTDVAWNAPMYLDAAKPWMLPEESVSHVYADNVIEHLPLAANRAFFRNAFRALGDGGLIRLATPDIERIARLYLDGPDELALRCMAQNQATGYEVCYSVDLLRNTFTEAGHHLGYLFDYSALSQELAAAGFTDVLRWEAGQSSHSVFIDLEARATETEAARELIVEATKVAAPPTDERERTAGARAPWHK